MLSVRTLGRACRNPLAAPPTTCTRSNRRHVRAAASGNALVVGGGFAGLAAAHVLTEAGLDVVLVEQGRGLGGRMCTRSITLGANGERITFDHGCQYLTARNPLFEAALNDLQAQGVLGQWGRGRPVGTAHLAEDGSVDMSTFTADNQKTLWVGNPTNSIVGRGLAARAGSRLTALTATRVDALVWDEARRSWRCRARQAVPTGGGSGGSPDAAALARLEAKSFDFAVTAMSSASTSRLLGACTSTSTGGTGGSGLPVVAPDVVAAADEVQSNVCWALMVAINKVIDVPFDGVLLSRRTPPGSLPQYGPIAWVSRDSSKPGRPAVAGGSGEAWVVHGGPDWGNARRDEAPQDVAAELLKEFAHLVQTPISPADVVHMEAHRWTNAYPLNPRPPQPPPPQSQQPQQLAIGDGATSGSGSTAAVNLAGYYILRPEVKLGVCGDWCKGPRAADAYVTGWEAAHALLQV